MPPQRFSGVKAQRKFAQGAPVPPSVGPAVAAECRRDVAHGVRPVTINRMTASNLLDVVSLQSADTTPAQSGLHSHLTSPQPVVLLERLSGSNAAPDHVPTSHAVTPTSRQPKSPAKKKVTPNKRKTQKNNVSASHLMILRSAGPNRTKLNKTRAPKKINVRKRKNSSSSDEDEPLIKKSRNNQGEPGQNATSESHSKEAITSTSGNNNNSGIREVSDESDSEYFVLMYDDSDNGAIDTIISKETNTTKDSKNSKDIRNSKDNRRNSKDSRNSEVSRNSKEVIIVVSEDEKDLCVESWIDVTNKVQNQTVPLVQNCEAGENMTLDSASPENESPRNIVGIVKPGCSYAAEGGIMVDAPIYHLDEEDFRDPIVFYEKIYSEIVKYGVCKVVPPAGYHPPFEVNDDIRFTVMNQYISRLFSRWGPAARELSAIKLCLQQQNINYVQPPCVDGVEVNLPKLYHLVQRLGGLQSVINHKRWGKVAEDLKITKSPVNDRKLDQIYMKFLLPYETLSHQERQEIMRKVELAWNKKNQKLLDRAMNPLYRQKRMAGVMDSSDEETEDRETKAALKQAEDCIIKGHQMQHRKFKKLASTAYENLLGVGSEECPALSTKQIEDLYWSLVTSATEHVCVHTAAVDTGSEGHGFSTKIEPYASHPWNPKKVIDNPRNVLRYLGSVVGVTVPTLLLGMLYSTSCWHKDPHAVPWYEYQSQGPSRIWYAIPAEQADNFRKAVETLSPTACQNKSLWLSSDITMIPPSVLRQHNVRLSRVTQNAGEIVLALPHAYTCCISTGYTQSESVYFAPPSLLDCLWTVFQEARESCEPTMFSMEYLLYNIGSDMKPEQDILKRALPLYQRIITQEFTNREKLRDRGLSFKEQLVSSRQSHPSTSTSTENSWVLDEECDYCRATLFLSTAKGLTGRNSVLCLEHVLMLLDTGRYKDADVKRAKVMLQVSDQELRRVHQHMKSRLNT